jgi:hypothetical protein
MTPRLAPISVLLTALAAMTGCQPEVDVKALKGQVIALEQEKAKLTEETLSQKATIEQQRKQIDTLQSLGGQKRLGKLYLVQSVSLGRYTGGIDKDGKAGDDGIKVYLEPTDQAGSVIKAAGEVKVRLYDLAAAPSENLVGEFRFDVDEVAKHWSGGFGVYHYSFECLWGDKPPKHDEITVRVEFTDYLTGKTFSAAPQMVCKVKLGTTTQPSTGPTTQPGSVPTTAR